MSEETTILIADDQRVDREILARQFSQDFTVILAQDGASALNAIEVHRGNLAAVLLDVMMPVMGGMDVLAEINQRGMLSEFAVFIISGDTTPEIMEQGFSLGAVDVIEKPVTPFVRHRVLNIIELQRTRHQLDEALTRTRAAQEDSQLFLDRMPGGLFRYRADGTEEIDYVSRGLLDIMGCDEEEFRSFTGNSFRGLVHRDDIERVEKEIAEQIAVGDEDKVSYRVLRPDGTVRWLEDWGRHVVDSCGQPWFYVVVLDMTEQIESQWALKRSNERLQILTDLTNDVVFDIDCRASSVHLFGDFAARFGRDLRFQDLSLLRRCSDDCHLRKSDFSLTVDDHDRYQGDYDDFAVALPDAQGNPVWCRYQSTVLHDEDGSASRHVGRLLDAHEQTMRELQYRESAEIDGLTGILNRKTAIERITRLLAAGSEPCALLFFDIDDFKPINDGYGHPMGDRVLASVAQSLRASFRDNDVVARFGGDEFLVFVSGTAEKAWLSSRIENIKQNVLDGMDADMMKVIGNHPTFSCGAALSMDSSESFDELYKRVDAALYEAKRQGKNAVHFSL